MMFSPNRIPFVFVLAVAFSSLSSAQDEKKEFSESSTTYTSRSMGDTWTYTIDSPVRDDVKRPDERALRSVTIQWERPEIDRLGNCCTVRGQLRIPAGDRGQTKPIDWPQKLAVCIAKQAGAKPDWSKGITAQNALDEFTQASDAGTFAVSIDMRAANRDRKLEQPFQFGLSFAKHTVLQNGRQRVFWSSKTPIAASSIKMLSVPRAPQLSREVELINRAAGWPFSNPDGVALINAVNALQKVGKEEALLMLEKYADLARESCSCSDQDVVFWIIRLLFMPIRSDDRIPRPNIGVHLASRDSVGASQWPLNPMDLIEDVPFMVGHETAFAGMMDDPSSHIKWARRHGVLRGRPLSPTKNPLAAAEELLTSGKFARLDKYAASEATELIKSQAMAMAGRSLQPLLRRGRDNAKDQADWKARVKKAEQLGITWDNKRNRFVVTAEVN